MPAAGRRGPTLLEDQHLREKISHFDHERIPERAVHARGTGAHGVFRSYCSASSVTKADFLAPDRGPSGSRSSERTLRRRLADEGPRPWVRR